MQVFLKWSELENEDGRDNKNDKEQSLYYGSRTFPVSCHSVLIALKSAPTVYCEVLKPVFPGDSTLEKPTFSIKFI